MIWKYGTKNKNCTCPIPNPCHWACNLGSTLISWLKMCLPKDFFVISHKIGINIHKRTQFKFYGENTTDNMYLVIC